MDKRSDVKYQQEVTSQDATHVVTGIIYGGYAFIVCDRNYNGKSEISIEKNKKVMIKLGSAKDAVQKGSDASADVASDDSNNYCRVCLGLPKLTNEEKKILDSFNVRCYGNITPPSEGPKYGTFEEAIKYYHLLSEHKERGPNRDIPMKVYLQPLTRYKKGVVKVMMKIDEHLVRDIEEILERIEEIDLKCSDTLKTVYPYNFQT